MTPACHIVHYRGKTIHYLNGVYKVIEFSKTYLSINEAIKEIDKQDTEFFFHLKKLNETNTPSIK